MRTSLLRLWLLKQVLSLPPACLRFFAGGGVVYTDGRTLDPQIQFLWRSWFAGAAAQPLSLAGKSLEQARQEWQDMAALLGTPSAARVRIEDIGAEPVGSPYGPSPMRGLLVRPATIAADAPLLVFFHQGGGVLGGPELSRAFCALFAHHARCPVFIPEYRLAPLYRFPAACEDARAAFEWAQANAFRLGATSGDVAVGGVLTGASLAARLCLDLRRDFRPLPAGQLLVTPLLGLADPAIKSGAQAGHWPLNAADLDIMVAHYAGAGVDPADPKISPATEGVLAGQPRTLIVSAGLDAIAPQAEAFAKRLLAARVRTIYRRYDTLPLGFDLFAGLVNDASYAVADMAGLWTEMLGPGREADTEALDVA
ncbi:alpha/beta hydrolase [Asticcacaulis solisilvae]|uniref:alpha/beta hydrolase n=1 Tax=Asticcacaulis solisilvae TaxID=1217274 RepID=UPI003FD7B7E4